MARNSEKAMTALARWRAMFVDKQKVVEKRPAHTSMCTDLNKALGFRKQIIKDISKRVGKIQNPNLQESIVRSLNDEINKLFNEKHHWDLRILELGGKEVKFKVDAISDAGKSVSGKGGYKYFGAARNLPGVKELFSIEPPPSTQLPRSELQKRVNIEYYGFHDEDDGKLLEAEIKREKELLLENMDQHNQIDIDSYVKKVGSSPKCPFFHSNRCSRPTRHP